MCMWLFASLASVPAVAAAAAGDGRVSAILLRIPHTAVVELGSSPLAPYCCRIKPPFSLRVDVIGLLYCCT